MRYLDALRYLYRLQPRGLQLGLQRMQAAAARLGHPERACPVVHIAGTNGKGSVAAMVAAVLQRAGYRTGLYTSPHLHRFVERIRVQGRPVGQRQVAATTAQLRQQLGPLEPTLTFFEFTTLLAFCSFRDAGCDIAVIEVGLGGRLDATNIVQAALCAITSIGLDHQRQLGRSLKAIATEKAGILKPGVPAVIGARQASARAAIGERAAACQADARFIGQHFGARASEAGTVEVWVGDQRWRLPAPLAGDHQIDNLAIAVATVQGLRQQGWRIDDASLRRGLRAVPWPGRLESLSGAPEVLLDAAHNPAGCASLAAYLQRQPRTGRRVLVFGAMADKAHAAMLRALRPHIDRCVLTRAPLPRAADPAHLRSDDGDLLVDAPADALRRAQRLAGHHGLVIVAGSIAVVGAVRAALLELPSDPPVAF